MELLDAFKWRYATKKFDSGKKVEQELVDKIVEAAWVAPTSSGLQPFEVFVISNQDLKDKFTEDDLYYILDVIVDYYTSSGCLDVQPDEEGYINIDQDEIVNYIVKEAKKDGMGPYDPNDVFFVVQGEMEYGNSLGQVD